MNKKLKSGLIIVYVIIIAFMIGMIYFLTDYLKSETAEAQTYDTRPVQDQELESVSLGKEKAPNELLFVFDYSCPYCDLWMDDIYPTIEEDFIKNGKVKFRTQSMVFLNDISLRLSNFDQNLKRAYPELYFVIMYRIMRDRELEQWGSTEYLSSLIHELQLNESLLEDPLVDSISITRKYTRSLEVDSVPSIFINGQRVEDPFNFSEIQSLLID